LRKKKKGDRRGPKKGLERTGKNKETGSLLRGPVLLEGTGGERLGREKNGMR